MYESMDNVMYNNEMSLETVWKGSIFVIPAIVEVYKIFENSSVNSIQDERIAIDGVFEDCKYESSNNTIRDFIFMSMSITFLIILSFFVKRVSFKKHILNGRPGPLLPMGMLDSHDHSFEYTLAFMSVSEDIYHFIFGFKSQFGEQIPIVKFFIKLAMVIFLSITSYLTFTGLQNKLLFGYIFGFVITACYSYQGISPAVAFTKCIVGTKVIPFLFAVTGPCVIDLFLLIIFAIRILKHIKQFGFTMKENRKEILVTDRKLYKRYVKLLLKQKKDKDIKKDFKIKKKINEKIYRKIPDFSLPPRLIIGICVGLYFSFRIFIDEIYSLTPTTWNFIHSINQKYLTTHTNLSSALKVVTENISLYSVYEVRNSYRFVTFFYTHLLITCLLTSIVFGLFLSVVSSFFILRNYRLHFHKLTRKGFSNMIDLKHAPPPYALVLGFLRFSGFQAAYILWGLIIFILSVTSLLYFIIGIFLIPLFYIKNSWSRKLLIYYGPVVIASCILNYIQTIIVKKIFIKGKGEILEIDNRRAFVIFSHCVFFLNAMIGMFSCLKRIIIWAFSGIICFCRIDFSALPDYLHGFDSGYMCYIGFLYTEQYHHNPVLRHFINILIESNMKNYSDHEHMNKNGLYQRENCFLKQVSFSSNKYRNKWRVAYTLIKNKSLILERKTVFKS